MLLGYCLATRLLPVLTTSLAALPQAGCLAAPATQEIQLGPPYLPVPQNFDLLHARRVERKGALDTHTVCRNTPYRERCIGTATMHPQHYTLEDLDAFALAFDDAIMHPDRITGTECRDAWVWFWLCQRSHNVSHVATTFRS